MKIMRIFLPILVIALYLGIQGGNLALFRQGHRTPVQVYNVSVALFPQADQKSLAAGIPIESQEQLTELLEAYLP